MKRTKQQEDIIKAVLKTQGHLAIVARAGCGKTTTILEICDEIKRHQPGAEVTVCAYNKPIADEVAEKLKKRGHNDWRAMQAATMHSMGWGLLRFVFRNPEIDEKKVPKIVDTLNSPVAQEYTQQITQLVRLAKQAGVGFFPDAQVGSRDVWYTLADKFDVNGLEDTTLMDEIVAFAQRVYRASLQQTDVVDFDDMILMPLVKNLRVKFQRDYLIIDEAQDLSRARQALGRKFVKPGTGRIILVGDDRQAIYGFSGADSDALPRMISELGAVTLPLSVTWRCPTAVVLEAQRYVPDIAAAPTAPKGDVRCWNKDQLELKSLTPADAILCRNTAPLVNLAYSIIRAGRPCKVEGRAIGDGLKKLVQRWKVKTVDALLNKLETYEAREVQKAQARDNDAKVQEVQDRCATVREICGAVVAKEGAKKTIDEVIKHVDDLFADGATDVTVLATYHRSKGREWPRVWLWEHDARCPSKAARQEWQKQQEANLAYVAITRAQECLTFIQ